MTTALPYTRAINSVNGVFKRNPDRTGAPAFPQRSPFSSRSIHPIPSIPFDDLTVDVDCVWGYAEFLKAIRDPKHPEHAHFLEWIGGAFDPEAFDPAAVNLALASIRLVPSLKIKIQLVV